MTEFKNNDMAIKPNISLKDYESRFARFDSLMQYRVKDILLVSSLYDSYLLEEDGQLSQLVFSKYVEFNLSMAPHLKRVSNGLEALNQLRERRFDIVIIFRWVSDVDIASFATEVKKINPDVPVVMLAFHARELDMVQHKCPAGTIDKTFFWTGDINIILTIVKCFEDRKNVDYDSGLLGVRVIILIEDSVRFYSSYLPLMYSEIMRQTQALMDSGLNQTDKFMRMRARPKILMADNFEEGWALFKKYKKYLLGVISDVRFKKRGHLDQMAGVDFARKAKEEIPDLPILLQSSDKKYAPLAGKNNASFIHKNSPTLLAELSSFINKNFGFGDFVFRMPDTTEIARATDFRSMEKCLTNVNEESILYHAGRNHFSNWLMARTEFDLADRLRPRKVSEFKDAAELRRYLIGTFKGFRKEQQRGIVSDFSRKQFDRDTDFVRIGGGSLGGKGRGLAFISSLMTRYNVNDAFEGFRISVPPSAVIGTAMFDLFLEENNLRQFAFGDHSDKEVAERFIKASLPKELTRDLKAYLDIVKYPLAVRSSSLLEDSHYQPFAGVFVTHMLPNCHANRKIRLARLEEAIKYTYASIFYNGSKNYIEATGNRVEEEKMAVILQKIVGNQHGDLFYPVFSGVARSFNFYPIGEMKPEEGVAYLALGLGKQIVEGGHCVRFSPVNPGILHQFSSNKGYLNDSQKHFHAVHMADPEIHPNPDGGNGIVKIEAGQAEADGTLAYIGSTYSRENDHVYDGISRKGIRLVTFVPLLKSKKFPVNEIIRFLLELGSNAMNCPVEIEFAVDMYSNPGKTNNFSFLQIRPMGREMVQRDISLDDLPSERIFCRCNQALSNGRIDTIRDILYVRPDTFDRANMPLMAREIGRFNQLFKSDNRPYLLIGPGRWGTADNWLGIPVVWNEISAARTIIEARYGDFIVTPSYGTHFIQNMIAFNIGYLTVNQNSPQNSLDWDWLQSQPAVKETKFIRHVALKNPVEVMVDGRIGNAVILKSKK